MNFLILHGTLGSPEGNWFPWLAGELEKLGHKTLRPQLPTPEGQTPENWVKVISDTVKSVERESLIVVAHSMSPLAVCQYLQTLNAPIRACFFVSGFAQKLSDPEEPYPTLNNPFIDKGADWTKVRQNCRKFICFAGDNDPYVPTAIARDFAAKLGAELNVIPNGGHLNADSGFTQFPQLLDKILSCSF